MQNWCGVRSGQGQAQLQLRKRYSQVLHLATMIEHSGKALTVDNQADALYRVCLFSVPSSQILKTWTKPPVLRTDVATQRAA